MIMLTDDEIPVLARLFDHRSPHFSAPTTRALHRLVNPVSPLLTGWRPDIAGRARSHLLRRVHIEQRPYWEWDAQIWRDLATVDSSTKLGAPITATSANISGAKSCSTAFEVYESLGNRIDMIMDGGETGGYLGSTVVDVTQKPPKIIREGIIQSKDLKEYL